MIIYYGSTEDYCCDNMSNEEVIKLFREGYEGLEDELHNRDLDIEVVKGYVLFSKERIQMSKTNLRNQKKELSNAVKDYWTVFFNEIQYKFKKVFKRKK